MATPIHNKTVAIAALFQVAFQIKNIARSGSVLSNAIAPLMRAIVITDPDTVADIYKDQDVKPGLNHMLACFLPKEALNAKNAEALKIVYDIIDLSIAIRKQGTINERLSNEIDTLRRDVLNKYPNYENSEPSIIMDYDIIQMYAKLYVKLISPNFPVLKISGDVEYLSRLEFQAIIRALLLAGIRAYTLFEQLGGSRTFLLLKHKEMISCAQGILDELKNN